MNKLEGILKKIENWPFSKSISDIVIGRTVKMVGASGISFKKLHKNEVVAELKNTKKVQNHIGQIHAAATTLLAETATGIVLGLNIPDNKLPLIKQFNIKFIKRSIGHQVATAHLSEDQIKKINSDDKGDILVPVKVIDSTGEEVIVAEMNWAWILKK